jgi:hypothetical protein
MPRNNNPTIPRKTAANVRRTRRLLAGPDIRVYHPAKAHEAGIFKAKKGEPVLLGRLSAAEIDSLIAEGALVVARSTSSGRTFRTVSPQDRVRPPQTARERRNAAWMTADKLFGDLDKPTPIGIGSVSPCAAESPIGWLARRRGADGKPFLDRAEVAAAERLRSDFERAQLAPGVTQDWKRFLTSGVQGGSRVSAQERDVEGGASAARERLGDALDALGPGLSDVAIRVCCFLEGIEAIETSMDWSRRSGKIVLKIALQRLVAFYEQISVRDAARIEAWSSTASSKSSSYG